MRKPNPAIVQLQACIEKYLRFHAILAECGVVFATAPLPRYNPKTNGLYTTDEITVGDRYLRLELEQADLGPPDRQKEFFEDPSSFASVTLVSTSGDALRKCEDEISFDPHVGWVHLVRHLGGKPLALEEQVHEAVRPDRHPHPTDAEAEEIVRQIARRFLASAAAFDLARAPFPSRPPGRVFYVCPVPTPHIPFLRIRPSIRSAFRTTLTLESAMAAEATIGSMRPSAASGTAATL